MRKNSISGVVNARPVGTSLRAKGAARVSIAALTVGMLATGFSPDAARAAQSTLSEKSSEIAQQGEARTYDIPAGPLAGALNRFADESGLQLVYGAEATAGKTTQGVSGTFTAEAALSEMLAGSGLLYSFTNDTTVTLNTPGDGATVLSPITVEGQRLSDPGRTEGTQSYAGSQTTVGSKIPVDVREIPQSVSVVTRERMDDRNFTTLQEAMAETTGARVINFNDARARVYSRGYATSILHDGVQIPDASVLGLGTSLDLAIYDRVEMMRGPAGIFDGAGEPGGAINLARKRPLDELTVSGKAQYGSWDFYRTEADVSAPLVESGKIRGRMVGVAEDKGSFVDVYESDKYVAYGTVEADLTANTLLSVGASYNYQDRHDWNGPPIADTNGNRVDLPRSTYIVPEWAKTIHDFLDVFADVSHRFDNGIEAKAAGRFVERSADGYQTYVNSAIDPTTGNVDVRVADRANAEKDYMVDTNVLVPLQAAGQEQKLLFGADFTRTAYELQEGNATITMNAYAPNHNIAQVEITRNDFRSTDTEEFGAYGQARLKPGIDWLTVVLGGRVSWYDSVSKDIDAGTVSSDQQINGHFTPSAGIVADVTNEYSVYGSYAGIFQPQTSQTSSGGYVEPREGEQYEVGVKGKHVGGRLRSHVSAYWLEDKNRATEDPNDANYSVAAGLVRSVGIEAEVSGEPIRGWNVFAGYAYNYSTYIDDPNNEGNVFSPFSPKHTLNLSTKYTFQSGTLQDVYIGGGVRAVSKIKSTDQGAPYGTFIQNEVAVFNASVGYRLNENIGANLTVNNLLDTEYYERIAGENRNNHWGEPRNFMLSVNAKW